MKILSKKDATKLFGKYNLPIISWTTGTVSNGQHQGMICDYTKLPGYTVSFTCAVYDRNGRMIERFNVR